MNDWSSLNEDEQAKHVYACAGLALYLAQCFEMSLSNFLLILKRLDNKQITESEFNSYDIELQKKTLGNILKVVKKFALLDQHSLNIVNAALEKRNFLAHHFFRERSELFFSQKGREKMVEELTEIQATFQKADAIGSALSGAVAKAAGITEEVIAREYEALKRKHESP